MLQRDTYIKLKWDLIVCNCGSSLQGLCETVVLTSSIGAGSPQFMCSGREGEPGQEVG